MRTDLSKYDNRWYNPGAGPFRRLIWYLVNALIFQSYLFPVNALKTKLLALFGAKIGKGVVIMPAVNIKYPWNLRIGDYSWIGEKVWIDNLAMVSIGSHACLSQGAMLLTGNHNYKKMAFDLIVEPITIDDGAWIGAQSLVCPGVTCHSHAVLAAQSVATANLEPYTVYAGNPAQKVLERKIS